MVMEAAVLRRLWCWGLSRGAGVVAEEDNDGRRLGAELVDDAGGMHCTKVSGLGVLF